MIDVIINPGRGQFRVNPVVSDKSVQFLVLTRVNLRLASSLRIMRLSVLPQVVVSLVIHVNLVTLYELGVLMLVVGLSALRLR